MGDAYRSGHVPLGLYALTRSLSLCMQYLGIQLVRALLTTRADTGPILCVCYTNHALDAFLLGLMDAGVENIVRAGGRSKEAALIARSVRELAKVRPAFTPASRC